MPPGAKRVLLLLPTTTYRAHDFIEAGRRMGVETVVGSDRRQALQDLQPERNVTLDLRDPARAAGEIAAFAALHPLDAVVPTDDETALVAALASQRLGLPHNPPEAARAARLKDVLRQRLQAAGVSTPRHHLLPVDADPDAAARAERYPCVLKPTFLAASRGVIRADDPRGFADAFRRIAALLADPDVADKGREAARRILVEDFVPGAEVALEGLLVAGRLKVLAIFDKPDPLDGPFFEETIYVTPSRLPRPAQEAIAATAAAAAAALGLCEGPIHAELRAEPPRSAAGEPRAWLIELAARSIGGLCSRTLRFGAGVSLEELILTHAIGRGVLEYERERQPAGVMMIPIPAAGILREIRGLDRARKVPGIVDVSISATLGRPLVPLPEGSSYLGFIFARGDSPAAVEAALRQAHRRLEIIVEGAATRPSDTPASPGPATLTPATVASFLPAALAAAWLTTACLTPGPGATSTEGPAGTPYSFPHTGVAIVRPDAVVFYSLTEDELGDLPAAERDGLKEVLPEFYAHIIAVEAALRQRGLTLERTSAPVLRFQDSDGTVQVYERRLHPGSTGMILFKHGAPIEAHAGVGTEQEILAAVDRYFSRTDGAKAPGED